MDKATMHRPAPGTGYWTVLLGGVRIGWIRGADGLGYEWGASNGCHGITRLTTRRDARDALIAHVQSHAAAVA